MVDKGVVKIEDEKILKKYVDSTLDALIEEKNPELSVKEKQEIAEKVGIGAIIYNDISQSREKNITFNWDRMLDFEAGSAVYLQYTYVRINSILEADEIISPLIKSNFSFIIFLFIFLSFFEFSFIK